MIIYFKKQDYPSDIRTYWFINSVKFKQDVGLYNASAINYGELEKIIDYLNKNFKSKTMICNYTDANTLRFKFSDEADEAHFLLLTTNDCGIEI